MKTYPAPPFWPILRKDREWTVKPRPGPHPQKRAIPLAIVLRDILGYAKNMREVKKLLAERKIIVDGVVRKDYKFPIGLMDVLTLPDAGKSFRVLPHPTCWLALVEIPREEASFKLCRVENKTTVKHGRLQLNLHDGRNVLIKVSEPFNPTEDVYRTLDVLKLSLPDGGLLDHYRLGEGSWVAVTGGENVGKYGIVESIFTSANKRDNLVTIRLANGSKVMTVVDYVFIIGKEKPEITIPGGS